MCHRRHGCPHDFSMGPRPTWYRFFFYCDHFDSSGLHFTLLIIILSSGSASRCNPERLLATRGFPRNWEPCDLCPPKETNSAMGTKRHRLQLLSWKTRNLNSFHLVDFLHYLAEHDRAAQLALSPHLTHTPSASGFAHASIDMFHLLGRPS